MLSDVAAAGLGPELPDRLEERQRLDVADRAADLDDDDVDVAAHLADVGLDLVGDVRDDLHRLAQVVAAPLLLDHRLVDLAGGEVVLALHDPRGEALVVAEVEVGLGAVVGDEHLAVLERRHGAGVDVDVGVDLEHGDRVAVGLDQGAERRRRDALAEPGNHAAGDEHVLGGHTSPQLSEIGPPPGQDGLGPLEVLRGVHTPRRPPARRRPGCPCRSPALAAARGSRPARAATAAGRRSARAPARRYP